MIMIEFGRGFQNGTLSRPAVERSESPVRCQSSSSREAMKRVASSLQQTVLADARIAA
jgi:hypothetical protein